MVLRRILSCGCAALPTSIASSSTRLPTIAAAIAAGKASQPESTKPDLELGDGILGYEGSPPCTRTSYTFYDEPLTYVVRNLGCTDRTEPKGTTGELLVSDGQKLLLRSWCRGG